MFPQGYTIASLDCSSQASHLLPTLTPALNLPIGTQGLCGGRMKPISCNGRNGDPGRFLCPGAPQGPSQYQA